MEQLPPDSFFRLFVKLNQLEQISHFSFLSGMLFNDPRQWWGTNKLRPHPHEGIDIYLAQDEETGVTNVRPQMLIPAMLPGLLIHIHRDFLGETLYTRHPEIRQESTVLHTLYGHVSMVPRAPEGEVSAGHSCSSRIDKGQAVGAISSPPATSTVPAHLHISCAWIAADLPIDTLNWENMSTHAHVRFIDPLPFLLR